MKYVVLKNDVYLQCPILMDGCGQTYKNKGVTYALFLTC